MSDRPPKRARRELDPESSYDSPQSSMPGPSGPSPSRTLTTTSPAQNKPEQTFLPTVLASWIDNSADARPFPLAGDRSYGSRMVFIPELPSEISERELREWLNSSSDEQRSAPSSVNSHWLADLRWDVRHPICLWIRTAKSQKRIVYIKFSSPLYAHLAIQTFDQTNLGGHQIRLGPCGPAEKRFGSGFQMVDEAPPTAPDVHGFRPSSLAVVTNQGESREVFVKGMPDGMSEVIIMAWLNSPLDPER